MMNSKMVLEVPDSLSFKVKVGKTAKYENKISKILGKQKGEVNNLQI